jgi:protocatechuate 3,4-dioxygenase beta subunit
MSRPRLRALLVLTSCGALLSAAPPQQLGGRGVIAGRIVDTTGAGVPGAEVKIGGPSGWQFRAGQTSLVKSLRADEHGDFAFDGLPAGEYEFSVTKPGYLTAMYNQRRPFGQADAVPLRDGERRLDLSITLGKLAVMTGIVTDDSGAPVSGTWVSAVRPVVRSGRRVLEVAAGDGTDDRGEYRISQLEPGAYALVIRDTQTLTIADPGGGGLRTLAYAQTLYPAKAADADPRELLRLDLGQEMTGLDLRAARVPAFQVAGSVSGQEGQGWTTVRLRSLDRVVSGMSAIERVGGPRPDGTFSFEGIVPGRYVVDAVRTESTVSNQTPQPPRRTWSASLPLVVGTADVAGVTLELRSGPRLMGRLEFDGAAARPTAAERQNAWYLRPESADANFYNIEPQTTVAGAGFTVTGLVTGRYVLRTQELLPRWVLRSITVDGRDVSVLPLDVGAADVSDVVVTFTDRRTSLSGVARGSTGAVERDTFVVAFPTDSRLWVDYGPEPRRLRGVQTERDGSFSMNLPEGEYFVVATAQDIRTMWRERSMLTRLAALADRINLREGDELTVNPRVVTIR